MWIFFYHFLLSSTNMVRYDPGPSSSSVQIVYPSAPLTVSMQHSQPLTLECVVSGSPAPAAKWFKNGKEVTLGPSHQQQHNNLAFARLIRSDEGRYSCRVETEWGSVMSPEYTVNVLGKKERQEKKNSRHLKTFCCR